MIRGYPARPSVAPGEVLTLHVSCEAPRFRVAFHRWGDGFVPMHETAPWPGEAAPEGPADAAWHWPAYPFAIPRDWPSGVYIAHLVEESGAALPLAPWMESAALLFVVRRARPARILYKLPIATYQAYNVMGGGCFYFEPPRSRDPARPGAKLTWHRPGGGTGGRVHGAPDVYDTSSPRQTFAHWDAGFVRWLAREGWRLGDDVGFCTDLDVHDDASILDGHTLLLSVGHDEYWSEPMRDGVERFVTHGGHTAFFGANVCWWRIHLVDDATAMVCHQGGPRGALDHWWPPHGAHRPEDAMTGVSYRHGGGWWDGERASPGFVVQQADHWAFEGTGLATGSAFGDASMPPLVGYECDGAPLEWVDAPHGRVRLQPEARRCGTPEGFVPLAMAPLEAGWQELPVREHHGDREGLHNATLGCFERGGTVFTAGTVDWAQVLAHGSDPHVATITRNVMRRLAGA